MRKNGVAVNGVCAIDFTLWNAPSAPSGSQIGSVQTLNPVSVTNGLFTVLLNAGGEFGPNAFTGDSRWLQADVKCPGDPAPAPPSRQLLSAAPYALSLRPGAVISAAVPFPSAVLSLTNSAIGSALHAQSDGVAVRATSESDIGVACDGAMVGVAGSTPMRGRAAQMPC